MQFFTMQWLKELEINLKINTLLYIKLKVMNFPIKKRNKYLIKL